jgi:hypothetical protein
MLLQPCVVGHLSHWTPPFFLPRPGRRPRTRRKVCRYRGKRRPFDRRLCISQLDLLSISALSLSPSCHTTPTSLAIGTIARSHEVVSEEVGAWAQVALLCDLAGATAAPRCLGPYAHGDDGDVSGRDLSETEAREELEQAVRSQDSTVGDQVQARLRRMSGGLGSALELAGVHVQ